MELLTVREAAERLQFSPKTIRAMVAAGELASVRRGRQGHIRILASALEDWAKQPAPTSKRQTRSFARSSARPGQACSTPEAVKAFLAARNLRRAQ